MIYGDDPVQLNGKNVPNYAAYTQSLNLYSYCGSNPVMYKDSTGQFWDIIFDICGLIWSAVDMIINPPLANAGFLLWDIGSIIIPFVPGSYAGKGIKMSVKAVGKVDDVVDVSKGFLKFTKGNFRENLIRLIGEAPGTIKKAQAHHVLPQADKFVDFFKKVGLDIHNPIFGAWVDSSHQSWSKAYEKAWEAFMDENKSATIEEILDFAKKLAKEYGFDVLF